MTFIKQMVIGYARICHETQQLHKTQQNKEATHDDQI